MDPFALLRTIARLLFRIVPPLVVVLLLLPVRVVVSLIGIVRSTHRLLGAPRRLLEASVDTVICTRCSLHQSLLGRWRCPCCRAYQTTHAWAPCGVCGVEVPAGYIRCEDPTCGEAIVHPRLRGLS